MKIHRFAIALLMTWTIVAAARAEGTAETRNSSLKFRLVRRAQLTDAPLLPAVETRTPPVRTGDDQPLLPPIPATNEQPELPLPKVEPTLAAPAETSPSDVQRSPAPAKEPVAESPVHRTAPQASVDVAPDVESAATRLLPAENQLAQGGYGAYNGYGFHGCGNGYGHGYHGYHGYFTPGCCDRPRSFYEHIWDGYCEENCFGFRPDDCEMQSFNGAGCHEGACLDNSSGCDSVEPCGCDHGSCFDWRAWLTSGRDQLRKAFACKRRSRHNCHAASCSSGGGCSGCKTRNEQPEAPQVEAPVTLEPDAI